MKTLTLFLACLLSVSGLYSKDRWFIGIKKNDHTFKNLNEYTPLFPPPGRSYADPMLIKYQGTNYIFFEDFDYKKGVIAYVTVDKDLYVSKPKKALEISTHLSFPFIFEDGGKMYMIPESYRANEVALYEAVRFPDKWKKKKVLLNFNGFDSIIFKRDGLYWIITSILPECLQIYYADSLLGEFKPHPINKKRIRGRNAGNIFVQDGRLIRPNINSAKTYGHHMDLFEIVELTTTSYVEKKVSAIRPTWAKNLRGTHTLSSNEDLMIYDGKVIGTPFPERNHPSKKYKPVHDERHWITHSYLPSLKGRVLFVGVATYTKNYHKYATQCTHFETLDFDPKTAPYGSPQKHYVADFLKFNPGYLYDHISIFGVLGHHFDARSKELYNIDSQKKITAALKAACQLLKPNGTLLIGPDQVSFKPNNRDLPHLNTSFWKDRLNQDPLDEFNILFLGEGRRNLLWWGKKKPTPTK
jgi:hypothetical protein